ncbi:hypothetical protein AB0J80_21900 [Actinoplanes sp. NPDC049548]|uniref:hypothetical protein n=1 Tax=Actinoplanes sp. NPDC049548 TaxID=3155152 RepID=UPI003433CB5D
MTVLVRGVPDAEHLARCPGLTVLCGSPAGLAAEGVFDTIVALDGLERLNSVESDQLTWAEILTRLKAVLRPGGLLIIGLANPLGLHRLLAAPRPLADSDWTPAPDSTRPATAEALTRMLGGAAETYACYPDPVAPALVLRGDASGGTAEAALARIYGRVPGVDASRTAPSVLVAASGQVVSESESVRIGSEPSLLLADPYPWALESLRQAQPLAPGWIVVATADRAALPSMVDRLGGPSGRTLESLIAEAAARRDLPAVRACLTAWRGSPVAGVLASQVIRGRDGSLTPLAPSSTPAQALRDLASRLLGGTGGLAWPAVRDAADLADILAAMTGSELGDQGDLDRGELDRSEPDRGGLERGELGRGELGRAELDGSELGRGELDRGELDRGEQDSGSLDARARADHGGVRSRGLARDGGVHSYGDVGDGDVDDRSELDNGCPLLPFAELLAERDRLARQLAEARAQAAFFESELTAREADLRGARRTVEMLSGTGPARAGQAFVGGVRAARRLLRRHG